MTSALYFECDSDIRRMCCPTVFPFSVVLQRTIKTVTTWWLCIFSMYFKMKLSSLTHIGINPSHSDLSIRPFSLLSLWICYAIKCQPASLLRNPVTSLTINTQCDTLTNMMYESFLCDDHRVKTDQAILLVSGSTSDIRTGWIRSFWIKCPSNLSEMISTKTETQTIQPHIHLAQTVAS